MSDPFGYINGLTLNPPKAKIHLFAEEPLLAFALVFLSLFFLCAGLSFEMSDTSSFGLNGSFLYDLLYKSFSFFFPLNKSTLGDFSYFSDPWMAYPYESDLV